MEELPGFIAEFDRTTVVHNDVSLFSSIREDLIGLTVEFGNLAHLELLINGYNEDPRALYEVPEVRRWIRLLRSRWPDALYWLTPGSLWFVVLSLNPGMHERLPEGGSQFTFDVDTVLEQFTGSVAAGEEALAAAGMSKAAIDRVSKQAVRNIKQMFERKMFGDYLVIEPKSGEVVTYRNQP